MLTSEARTTSNAAAEIVVHPAPQPAHDSLPSFHDVLSAMNPLQYLPVVGTIYRAVTGDVIPEAVQRVGSLAVSFLLGGPIGVITNIATTILEKLTGIDPEKIGQALLAPSAAAPPAADPPAQTVTAPAQPAWTPAQLAAYGVRPDASGELRLGDVAGADVFNTMELVRLGRAMAAYATTQNARPVAASAGA